MPQTVSLLLVLESVGAGDGPVCELLQRCANTLASAELEGTFLLDSARVRAIQAKHPDLVNAIKRQNLGYLAQADGQSPMAYSLKQSWGEGAKNFLRTETDGYNAACWMSAALPAAAAMRGWAPQPFATMAEWGIRAILGPTCPVGGYDRPFFYGGRLHLASLGPNWLETSFRDWLEPDGVAGLIERVGRRSRRLASPGGVLVVRIPLDALAQSTEISRTAAMQFAGFIERLRQVPDVAVQSARQIVDRFADISYEHAVPVDVFRNIACWVWSGELRPFFYEQGFLSPAEQLYGMARIWHESIQKGKPVRNTTIKTPLGPPERASTDASVLGIAADELPGLLDTLVKTMDNTGQLPASVTTKSGRIAIQDLLPTLADGLNPKMEPVNMEVRRGFLDESRLEPSRLRECLIDAGLPADADTSPLADLAKLQLWTYKPVIGLTG